MSPIRLSASRVMPRIPQWMSVNLLRVHLVEDPRRGRRADVAMEGGHRSGFDGSSPSGSHGELVALTHLLHEQAELAKVVGEVGIAHDDVLSPDKGDRVDVGPSKPELRCLQHPGPGGQCQLSRSGRWSCRR